eukprot:scaffold1014_cov260-Pinguiococcus_pyrenoidosus.AAC.13
MASRSVAAWISIGCSLSPSSWSQLRPATPVVSSLIFLPLATERPRRDKANQHSVVRIQLGRLCLSWLLSVQRLTYRSVRAGVVAQQRREIATPGIRLHRRAEPLPERGAIVIAVLHPSAAQASSAQVVRRDGSKLCGGLFRDDRHHHGPRLAEAPIVRTGVP